MLKVISILKKFHCHIEQFKKQRKKVSPVINCFHSLKNTLQTLYQSYILILCDYCDFIWDNVTKCQEENISHRQDCTSHNLCYTSYGALAGMRNISLGPPWRIDLTTHHSMRECSLSWSYISLLFVLTSVWFDLYSG